MASEIFYRMYLGEKGIEGGAVALRLLWTLKSELELLISNQMSTL